MTARWRTWGFQLIGGGVALAVSTFVWGQIERADRAMPRLEIAPLPALPAHPPRIAVVMPARNEARGITRSLRSLLAQRFPITTIYVIDDGSTDGTVSVVQAMERHDPRIRLVRGAPRPTGWAGKNWAMQQGIQLAIADGHAWIFLTDADTWHHPELLGLLWRQSDLRHLDLLSVSPTYDEPDSGAVLLRAAIGELYSFVYGADYPLRANDPRSPAALAMGQCVFVRSEVLRAIDGYAAPRLRSALADDRALALTIKARTGRVAFAAAPNPVRTAGYGSLGEAWQGHAHHLWPSVIDEHGDAVALAAIGALQVATVWPVLALGRALWRGTRQGWHSALPELLRFAAQVVVGGSLRWRAARLAGLPRWYIFAGPVGTVLAQALLLQGVRQEGRGITWKGRRYVPPPG